MKILLDTNIVSALFKGETNIATRMDKATSVHIPLIVLGELYYGAYNSVHIQRNLDSIVQLSQRYELAAVDDMTAKAYGSIKATLRKNGTPIPENDIWIAAIAFRNDYTLITRDKHFKEIQGINIEQW